MLSDIWDSIDPEHPMYFDKQGQPITLRQWCSLREDRSDDGYHRIALDHIDLFEVSTVWTGLDMAYSFTPHQPVLFETMVFHDDMPQAMPLYRYRTEEEALAGHEAVCAELQVAQQVSQEHHPTHRNSES